MNAEQHGAFSREFAEKKTWKVDKNLFQALDEVIPAGKTVVELGAGIGRYVEAFKGTGRYAWGYDGIEGIEELSNGLVRHADLSEEECSIRSADVCLSIETWEHIPRERELSFARNLVKACTRMLIVSCATPGQRGRNHVNCRTPEKVVDVVSHVCREPRSYHLREFFLDEEKTLRARRIAGKGWDRKLLVFT